jgi:hypothetical protein
MSNHSGISSQRRPRTNDGAVVDLDAERDTHIAAAKAAAMEAMETVMQAVAAAQPQWLQLSLCTWRGSVLEVCGALEADGSTLWPMLTKTNYKEWSLVMKVKMQARKMWDAVRRVHVDFHDDRRALEAILTMVLLEMAPTLAVKETAK